jgi:hypothetical protein
VSEYTFFRIVAIAYWTKFILCWIMPPVSVFLFILWLFIIPVIWTYQVAGKVGTSESGTQMIVAAVEPYPSTYLWCYRGVWQYPDEEYQLPGGSIVAKGKYSYEGRVYVGELKFDQPLKELPTKVWKFSQEEDSSTVLIKLEVTNPENIETPQ